MSLKMSLAIFRHDVDRKVMVPLRWWFVCRLPRCVVKWALVRAGTDCIGRDEEVPGVPFVTVLQRWGKR